MKTVTAVLFVLAAAGSMGLRPHASQESSQNRPLFTTGIELVVRHVTVTDRKGSYVADLPQEAFRVVEDGQPQSIHLFSGQDAPATVGLLIDASGSMQPVRDLVIAAATAFAESSNPQDELFALAFNDDVRAALPPAAPFTGDAATLRNALARTLAARGRTALYDAIANGLEYVARGHRERKVLVVISDGGDNASTTPLEEVVTKTQASNTVVFTIGLIDPAEPDSNPKRLKQIAEPSGGQAFTPRNASQVAGVLQRISHDIRHSYTIGYVPTEPSRKPGFHRIRVTARAPDGRQLEVRTRAGYLTEPER